MPIPYEKLKYEDILCHQEAYNYFDDAGHHLFSDWDMNEFEKAVLGAGNARYLAMAEGIMKIPTLFHNLNAEMPFLKFREEGQHYGYELFLTPPSSWCSRGAPFWWAYAARQFTYDKLPMDEKYLYNKYKEIAKKFGLKTYGCGYAHIPQFSAGGMSSGVVTNEFVSLGLRTLKKRNSLYLISDTEPPAIYLDEVINRINWYLKSFQKTGYMINPEFNEEMLRFALADSKATPHQKEVISLKWGIHSAKPLTTKQVAEHYGVTPNRIRQIENRLIYHILFNKNGKILVWK